MSITTRARYDFGYRFWNEDEGYLVDGPDPLKADWYDVHGDTYQEQALDRLLAAAGFVDDGQRDDAYYDRRLAAKQQIGVGFELTGYEFSDLLLVATAARYETGPSSVLTVPEVDTTIARQRLAHALEVLGIRPRQQQPEWLLSAYYA